MGEVTVVTLVAKIFFLFAFALEFLLYVEIFYASLKMRLKKSCERELNEPDNYNENMLATLLQYT